MVERDSEILRCRGAERESVFLRLLRSFVAIFSIRGSYIPRRSESQPFHPPNSNRKHS